MSGPSVTWVDDFTADHFTDRYDVRAGVEPWTFSVTPDGLRTDAVAWADPTNLLGDFDLVVVELDFVSFASAGNMFIGFQPPGSAQPGSFSGKGVWLNVIESGVCQVIAGDGLGNPVSSWKQIAHYFGELHPHPSDALLTMRLTIDRLGMVTYGVAADLDTDGWFLPTDGVAKSIGGYGRLTPEALASLADCVPIAEVEATGFVTRWAYWIFGGSPNIPGLLQGGLGSHGQLRAREIN